MEDNWLTADLVKDIQYALQSNRSIDERIKSLQGTTLPGIVDYKCLIWSERARLPPLPFAVTSSPIGRAAVSLETHLKGRCHIGPAHISTVAPQSVEFTTLSDQKHLSVQAWDLFEARLNRSARAVGFSERISNLLQAALHEMAENALLHSGSPFPVVAGYHAMEGFVQFCVADIGIGVLASLRGCTDYKHLSTHKAAIRMALHDGISRFGRGGCGFRPVFKAVASEWGLLRFRSGEGCVFIDGKGCQADSGEEHCVPFVPGFQVTVSCRAGSASFPHPII